MKILDATVQRIDWERVLIDIQQSSWARGQGDRMSLESIGDHCGRSFGWAWNLKNIPGTEPRGHDALRLLLLWAECTGNPGPVIPSQVPRLRDLSGT